MEPAAVAQFAWDFPLSRQEKMHRVLLLFEGEVDRGEREISSLRKENKKLRNAVQSLAAVTMSPRAAKSPREQQTAKSQSAAQDVGSSQQKDQSSNGAQPVSEAQRVASYIDQASRSVVEETYSLIDHTTRKVAEDTEDVNDFLKRSTAAVDAEAQRVASLIDQTSRSVVEETYSFIDHTSKKVEENTEEVNEFLKSLHERSTLAVDAAISDVDAVFSESAKSLELKRDDVLQTLEEWRAESAGLATVAQSQLEELGGKAQEFGASLGQAFEASLGWWGQQSQRGKRQNSVH